MNQALLQDAMRLRRAGKLNEAAEIYGQVLRNEPRHFEALHALGILSYQRGRLEEAEKLIRDAMACNPNAPDAAYNHACLLQKLNRQEEAIASFDRALALKPDYIEALVNRSTVLSGLKRYGEALANSDRVVAIKPELAEAWGNRGGILLALERLDESLASYDRAVALKPVYVDAWKNRAVILSRLNRHPEALEAIDKALALAPKGPDLFLRRADVLALLNRHEEAASDYERYLTLTPTDADAWHARGFALKLARRRTEALACFDQALALAPGRPAILESRGNLFFELERFEEAARDYEALLATDAPPSWARGYVTICRLHGCDWRGIEESRRAIAADLKAGKYVLDPMGIAILSDSLEDQLSCARIWAKDKVPRPVRALWNGERYRHDRIRLAYLSADFRTHATAFLMAGVFEQHDRSQFETVAVSYSTNDRSPMRSRLEASFDRFVDVLDRNDTEVAQMMRDMEIDIAVDLKGYTAESRPGILAARPAPVQAHYLGFPGTMGAECVDYLIADPVVVPPEHRAFYTEKIAYLPDAYQCNDRRRKVAERTPTRFEMGLPEGFVFCCFNNNHKLMPEMFDVWMRVLGAVDGSVLWLLQTNPAVAANLRREAKARGISPDRLVFAARADPSLHLARQSLADLFLDTVPYNAHTTTSDALWVGLPVLTVLGSTFAGRVAASLLQSAGVPELVTRSLPEYEELAVKLAREPWRLASTRAKLRGTRDTCALFDTTRITRSLESVYCRMWDIHQSGSPPETFAVGGVPPQ
jgi:predicted O-linked N-acetylglucosamine transferase (SPINDLY family)